MGLRIVYGGTFDPVHCGHLAVARAARDLLDARVHLMPAADPPHRAAPGASAAQRARMLELAVAGESGLEVDRRELSRSGRSYSIDTLRDIRAEVGPGQPVAMLVGADSFLGLPQWRDWRDLFTLVHFVVAERPGSALEGPLAEPLASQVSDRWTRSPAALASAPAGRVFRLHQPLRPESASAVREQIRQAGRWREMVPPAVAGHITASGLYGVPSA
ncbi:MAG: nicotinate-nucleotide adenylyltransferase [Pseudomonadota bacterium]|nr:nicotinate-nucleotide adenylyltransferase [Pseudomonadota bacterium]